MPDTMNEAKQFRAMQSMAVKVGWALSQTDGGYQLRQHLPESKPLAFPDLKSVANFLATEAGIAILPQKDKDGNILAMAALDSQGQAWFWGAKAVQWEQVGALPADAEEALRALLPEAQKPTAEYPTQAEAQASIDANPDLQEAGAQVEVTPKGTYKVTFPGEQPLAGPQFIVGEDGNVYRRDVADGAWKLVEAQDVPSLNDEIDRLILEGTPEAEAEARRLYQAKQRVTGAAEAQRQADATRQQAQRQTEARERFNQALQLVDLAQNDPARLDMVLKLLQQSGLWPFDGSMDPLQAVQQQVQQAPGFVQGFGSQAQRQAAVEENIRRQETGQPPITLGQVEAFAQKGAFGAGPQVRPPDFGPGGEVLDIGFIPGPEGLPPSPPEGLLPPGMNLPGMGGQPSFEDAAAQFNQQLVTAMTSGQITEEQRNQAWQDFLKQWGQYPGASMGKTAGGMPITFGAGFSPTGEQNYLGGWVDVPGVGVIPAGAAQAYESQQKELEALTPGSPYYGAITLDPASLKQGTPISELPSVQDVLGRQFRVSPQQEFTYLGGGPRAGGMPPITTGNKFVDWLKVIQDQAKERARAEAQKSNRLGGTFGRPVAGGSVRYG